MSGLIEKAEQYIHELYQHNSDGHDESHSLRVYHNAMQIAEHYPECDKEIVSLGALLHDCDDCKLFHTQNNANARAFLEQNGISQETISRICIVINEVSFSHNRGKKPSTLEGEIVQDADRLDAIGAIGIARVFAFGGKHGRSFDDSIRHFYDKLLLLKDLMNTEEARKIAERRHQYMLEFLREYKEETED